MSAEPPKRRRWFQFRLRTLLIAVLVLSLPLSWFAVRLETARRQREAVEAITRLGGQVEYHYRAVNIMGRPLWLRNWLGVDFFADVDEVRCVGDDALRHVDRLVTLKKLSTRGDVTDAGLQHIAGLTRLEEVNIYARSVTDQGLMHLAGLAQLKMLTLRANLVTDSGLKHLRGLSQLEMLNLSYTQITDVRKAGLEQALPKCSITFFSSG